MNNLSMDFFSLNLNRKISEFCRTHNLVFNWLLQIHSDEKPNSTDYAWREPTPEEISVQSYLGLAFGARQMFHYWYFNSDIPNYNSEGLINSNKYDKRINTYYTYNNGSDTIKKYDPLVTLNNNIMALGNYLYPAGQSQQFLIY